MTDASEVKPEMVEIDEDAVREEENDDVVELTDDVAALMMSKSKDKFSVKKASNHARKQSSVSLVENDDDGGDRLEQFLEAIRSINNKVEPGDVAQSIIKESCMLLNADRATIFYIDDDANELVMMVAKGARNIRIPMGAGIAGSVAVSGQVENIPDAYQDNRFSSSFDKSSGYKTNAILAAPVHDGQGEIVAVLQIINKRTKTGENTGKFSPSDCILLENLASHVGVVLRNAHLYEAAIKHRNNLASMLELIKMLHSGTTNTHSLIFTLNHRCNQLVEADRCTLYLADDARKQLVVMQGDVDIRIPLNKGLAGWVATHGQVLNIMDAYEDDRFSQHVDKQSGYRTKSVLCMPIWGEKDDKGVRPVVGVLQVINKVEEGVFSRKDIDLLETLLNIAGPILQTSSFFLKRAVKHDGGDDEHISKTPTKPVKEKFRPTLNDCDDLMMEEDEEDLDEDEEDSGR